MLLETGGGFGSLLFPLWLDLDKREGVWELDIPFVVCFAQKGGGFWNLMFPLWFVLDKRVELMSKKTKQLLGGCFVQDPCTAPFLGALVYI
jgi:hypothetical protein